ncbi:MAG TPA: GNAT family protein [Kofleriaceae bacterium]|nr:GNAT family protein [Kofleriaceae bacterium]
MPGPAYRVETARLILRCWDPVDAGELLDVITADLDQLRPWLPWAARYPMSVESQMAELRRMRRRFDGDEDFCYGVFDKQGSLVGGCGLHTRSGPGSRELGYWLRAARWGQGLATELAAALTRVAFEVDEVERVDLRCAPHNQRSARVAEKLGFRHEATLRRRFIPPGGEGPMVDALIWSLVADELADSPVARLAAGIRASDGLGRPLL